jgi:hypothetical protein
MKMSGVTLSSGNVFADLGFANPEEELLKAKLVGAIHQIIKKAEADSEVAEQSSGCN